jgi:predicted DNA-binding transcriptional regulator AlpA
VSRSAAIPSLEELACDPSRASGLPADVLAALAARCAAVQSTLATAQLALVLNGGTIEAPANDGDRLLVIEEAAAKLSMTEDQLYRRKDLPFRVKLGPGQLRFSSNGIERYIRQAGRKSLTCMILASEA